MSGVWVAVWVFSCTIIPSQLLMVSLVSKCCCLYHACLRCVYEMSKDVTGWYLGVLVAYPNLTPFISPVISPLPISNLITTFPVLLVFLCSRNPSLLWCSCDSFLVAHQLLKLEFGLPVYVHFKFDPSFFMQHWIIWFCTQHCCLS